MGTPSNVAPFQPVGSSYVLAVGTAATTSVQVPATSASTYDFVDQIRVVNPSGQAIFIAWGVSSAAAASAAVVPTVNTAQAAHVVMPTSERLFTVPAGSWINAVTAVSTATIYVTAGAGSS